jgi:Mg2+ and Co2+ transporter CorA
MASELSERVAELERRLLQGEVSESWLAELREAHEQLMLVRAASSDEPLLLDEIDCQRDILRDLYELYLEQSNLRVTRSAGTLGALTLILVIDALIAGIYGMNVNLPAFDRQLGFLWSLALIVVASIASWWVLHRRGWF